MKAPVFDPSWSDEVKRVYEHDLREIWDSTIARHVFNMYHAQLELFFSLVDETTKEAAKRSHSEITTCRILDVGCAQGTLALKLAEQGHKVTAIDLRQGFLDYAQSRWTHGDIQFIQGNVLELDLSNEIEQQNGFDIIFANQIIEHLVYPLDMVEALTALLNDNGKLIVTTPNGQYIKNSLPSFTEIGDPAQWEDKQFTADGDGHFFAYLDSELSDIFRQAGLQDIQTQNYETPWVSGHIKFRYLHSLLPYRWLSKLNQLTLQSPLGKRMSHQLLISGTRRSNNISK